MRVPVGKVVYVKSRKYVAGDELPVHIKEEKKEEKKPEGKK